MPAFGPDRPRGEQRQQHKRRKLMGAQFPERPLVSPVQYAVQKGDRNQAAPSLGPRRSIGRIGLVFPRRLLHLTPFKVV
jgi:hypothetical protein